MEWTPHWSPRASSDTVSCSFSYHIWQFIIFTFSTITACIISYSLRNSFRTQDLALQQILSSIDLFLFYRTDYTDSRTMLNGCTGKCVRLSRPLVVFWTHFKSPHFHSFISFHSFHGLLSTPKYAIVIATFTNWGAGVNCTRQPSDPVSKPVKLNLYNLTSAIFAAGIEGNCFHDAHEADDGKQRCGKRHGC